MTKTKWKQHGFPKKNYKQIIEHDENETRIFCFLRKMCIYFFLSYIIERGWKSIICRLIQCELFFVFVLSVFRFMKIVLIIKKKKNIHCFFFVIFNVSFKRRFVFLSSCFFFFRLLYVRSFFFFFPRLRFLLLCILCCCNYLPLLLRWFNLF